MDRSTRTDSSECAEKIEEPSTRRDPPARGLCAPQGRLSKTESGELPATLSKERDLSNLWMGRGVLGGCRAPFGLLKPRAHARSTLRAAAAVGGFATRPAVDRQLAGAAVSSLSRRGDAELLFNVDAATPRAVGQVAGASDQGLEVMVAGLTVVFIEWHTEEDSSVSVPGDRYAQTTRAGSARSERAQRSVGILEGKAVVVNARWIGFTGGAIAG